MASALTGLLERIDALQARMGVREPLIHAFLPEPGRFERLRRDAQALVARYPHPDRRPPLFGLFAAVKDLFHVDGFPTRAGSRLPPEALQGEEADSVSRLRAAGALIVGKTVTTEFAHFAPGPTRNPHNPEHTPGGSSSGSAAAVAAGFCDVALGTQTIGSIIRPAAFCGVVGLKPTAGRISLRGVIPLAPSLDHVGCLAASVEGVERTARALYTTWSEARAEVSAPVLGIPQGPYLDRVPADTRAWFTDVCRALTDAGYEIRDVPVMADFDALCARHHLILGAEAARSHARWFAAHAPLYGQKMADLITRGQAVTAEQLAAGLIRRDAFRAELGQRMKDAHIDLWICPSTLGPAPKGLESTGDPVMNLPWTHAGFPAVGLPAGRLSGGLPLGLQVVGDWGTDEWLLRRAVALQAVVGPQPTT